jgi:hypothetical protein
MFANAASLTGPHNPRVHPTCLAAQHQVTRTPPSFWGSPTASMEKGLRPERAVYSFATFRGLLLLLAPLRVKGDMCGRLSPTVPVHVRRDGVLGSGVFQLDRQPREMRQPEPSVGASAARCGIMIRMTGAAGAWPGLGDGGLGMAPVRVRRGPRRSSTSMRRARRRPRQVPGDSESPSCSFSGAGGRPMPAAAGPGPH